MQLCQVPAASRAAAPCFPRWPWRLWSRLQRWLPRRFQGWIPRWQVGLHQSLINHLLNLRCKKQCKRHVVSDAMHVQVPRDADYAETFITCKSLTHGFFSHFCCPHAALPALEKQQITRSFGPPYDGFHRHILRKQEFTSLGRKATENIESNGVHSLAIGQLLQKGIVYQQVRYTAPMKMLHGI